jgi:hypothetical protein
MIKLTKRGLLIAEELPREGEIFKVVRLQLSTGDFYKYDLLVKDSSGKIRSLGLQQQSINMDSLIDELSDNPELWSGKDIVIGQSQWNDRAVIRVMKGASKRRNT